MWLCLFISMTLFIGIIVINRIKKLKENKLIFSSFTDSRDGITYKTVKIGNLVWMAENLNYNAGEGSWCYNDDPENAIRYGRLYDWETANEIAPSEWRLPSIDDFEYLLSQLGGEGIDSYKRMVSGGSSGFNVLLSGYRIYTGSFARIGVTEEFWSSSETDELRAKCLSITSLTKKAKLLDSNGKDCGLCVRCVKNTE